MILSFSKPEFRDKILSGEKIHTLREDPKRRWRYGLDIQFYLGNPRNGGQKFLEKNNPHITLQEVEIFRDGMGFCGVILYSANYPFIVSKECVEQLSKNDGFDSVDDFFEYFLAQEDRWKGRIICWTGHRYIS